MSRYGEYVNEPFFRSGDFPCEYYCRTRDKTDTHNIKGRQHLESLWKSYGNFLDPDVRERATLDMPAAFWELYLTGTLKRLGIDLQQQSRTKQNKKGPDLFAINPEVWIEAVMPGVGTGPDAVEDSALGVASDTPVATFILRLRSAFEAKAKIIAGYIDDGLIKSGQGTVIAISGAMLPTAFSDSLPPRVVRALLGVGNIVLDLNTESGKIVGQSLEHRDQVTKKSGAAVTTFPFDNPAYRHISAVAYSCSNWVTYSEKAGVDFTVIHNENADVKLRRGWLNAGHEYWRENDQLQSTDHNATSRGE
jgi:hypothetical protein